MEEEPDDQSSSNSGIFEMLEGIRNPNYRDEDFDLAEDERAYLEEVHR